MHIYTRLVLVTALATVSACTTYTTSLRNKEGAITHCDESGWGLIGGAIAGSQHNECVKNAHDAGYSEVPEAH
jgi:hypothetical protein